MKDEKIEDIGIYTNIHESGRRNKDGNKMFYATCKICGTVVEKKLSNIKRSNKLCRHKKQTNRLQKINDMPTGWVNLSDINRRIYNTWRAMLYRTTQKCWDKNPTYTGTTVDESWLRLSNFVNDIQELSGYDEWICSPKKTMMLDKDTLIEGNKHYSKETCCFITYLESSRDVNKRHPNNTEKGRLAFVEKSSIPIKAINKKTKEEKTFSSLQDTCRELNLNFRNAWQVLSDKYPSAHSVKGWFIEKLDKSINI